MSHELNKIKSGPQLNKEDEQLNRENSILEKLEEEVVNIEMSLQAIESLIDCEKAYPEVYKEYQYFFYYSVHSVNLNQLSISIAKLVDKRKDVTSIRKEFESIKKMDNDDLKEEAKRLFDLIDNDSLKKRAVEIRNKLVVHNDKNLVTDSSELRRFNEEKKIFLEEIHVFIKTLKDALELIANKLILTFMIPSNDDPVLKVKKEIEEMFKNLQKTLSQE